MEDYEKKLTELFMQDLERWDPLLVSLIRSDEIDPWSVDIQKLCTAYLSSVQNPDFRKHGKTVLTLAILLKLKSEELDIKEFWGEEEVGDEIWDEEDDMPRERQMVPRLVPIRARSVERRVTLGELVTALRTVMDQKRTRAERRRVLDAAGGRRMEVKADLNIGQLVGQMQERINELWQAKGTALFSEVAGSNRDEALWSLVCLLHLYFENTVGLDQKEWWGDILITERSYDTEVS